MTERKITQDHTRAFHQFVLAQEHLRAAVVEAVAYWDRTGESAMGSVAEALARYNRDAAPHLELLRDRPGDWVAHRLDNPATLPELNGTVAQGLDAPQSSPEEVELLRAIEKRAEEFLASWAIGPSPRERIAARALRGALDDFRSPKNRAAAPLFSWETPLVLPSDQAVEAMVSEHVAPLGSPRIPTWGPPVLRARDLPESGFFADVGHGLRPHELAHRLVAPLDGGPSSKYWTYFGPDGDVHFFLSADGKVWRGEEVGGTVHWREQEVGAPPPGLVVVGCEARPLPSEGVAVSSGFAPTAPAALPAWFSLVVDELARARTKFPRPDLVVTALSEEIGELVREVLENYHGKGSANRIRREAFQSIAMVVRLLEEGDPVHRLEPVLPLWDKGAPVEDPPEPRGRVVPVAQELLRDIEEALGRAEGLGPCGLGLLCQVQDLLQGREVAGIPERLRALSELPPWPPQRKEGGLLVGSFDSVPVLGLIKKWGWHPVVCHEDDDDHPVRHYWEDPAGLFKPHELRERLLGWVPMPPVPTEAGV